MGLREESIDIRRELSTFDAELGRCTNLALVTTFVVPCLPFQWNDDCSLRDSGKPSEDWRSCLPLVERLPLATPPSLAARPRRMPTNQCKDVRVQEEIDE